VTGFAGAEIKSRDRDHDHDDKTDSADLDELPAWELGTGARWPGSRDATVLGSESAASPLSRTRNPSPITGALSELTRSPAHRAGRAAAARPSSVFLSGGGGVPAQQRRGAATARLEKPEVTARSLGPGVTSRSSQAAGQCLTHCVALASEAVESPSSDTVPVTVTVQIIACLRETPPS
jgi:hypothetical protein